MMNITFLYRPVIYVAVCSVFSGCYCVEEKVELNFSFGQTATEVDLFMQQNGLSSIEEIDCADLCMDFDPALTVRFCDVTWEQEYLDSMGEETEQQRESPTDSGSGEPSVNSVTCEGTSYQACD